MNILYTSKYISICAKDHCKVHTRKMIVEYLQLLSTAHHILDKDAAPEGIYKPTHVNHPCAIWVRESSDNYNHLFLLVYTLLSLYKYYTGKDHKSYEVCRRLAQCPVNIDWEKTFTEPPKCMPEEFRHLPITEAYKVYLNIKYKDWTSRTKPVDVSWYTDKPEWVKF